DQYASAVAAQRHGGGVEVGNAGGDLVGLCGVREDLALRGGAEAAAGRTGQGQRGAHEGEELPPAHVVRELGGALGDLVVHHLRELRCPGEVVRAGVGHVGRLGVVVRHRNLSPVFAG